VVNITVSVVADFDLSVHDIWPDGDAPEVVTAEVVAQRMEADGTKSRVLADWGLFPALDVTVHVNTLNPAWKQAETLIGDPPPRVLSSRANPWCARAREDLRSLSHPSLIDAE